MRGRLLGRSRAYRQALAPASTDASLRRIKLADLHFQMRFDEMRIVDLV